MSDLYINAYEITGADDMRWPGLTLRKKIDAGPGSFDRATWGVWVSVPRVA
jgi:hypothetical protein